MGEPRALLATALSPPSLSGLERTILLLKEVGPCCRAVLGKLRFQGEFQKSRTAALLKVAELYEELKTRISQFNMYVDSRRPVMDQEYVYKQRFILQVVLAGAFYPNYFTFGQPDEEMAVRELAGKDPKTTVVLKHIPPYGFLYYKQLQSLFRQCGQVKSIVFDGAKVNVDFQKQTVDPMQVSFNTLDGSQMVTDLLLTIDVTEVVEVGHFWGYRIDEKNSEILKKLTAEINRLKLLPLAVHPHPDLVCLAPFADFDKESYFRAQILYVSGDSAEALEFKICKMRPSARSLVCGEPWSSGASQRFASLVSGCALLVKVFSVVHSVLHVDVYRCSGVQDAVNIRDVLVTEGHAELAEEPYASKAILHGPFNPYELKCHSLTRISKFRCVWIEKESINSVVVSDSPEEHQRVLVAASLSVNATGSTMLLRETSLMPHIPGLLALLSMLFTPVMELSVDRAWGLSVSWVCSQKGVSFEPWPPCCCPGAPLDLAAGHRIGGVSPSLVLWPSCPGGRQSDGQGAPVLPEHDIELAFDVQLGVEDVVEVDPKLVMEQTDRASSRSKNTFLYQLHKLIVLST
ncbi:hypothetical protein CB1_001049006 [Camelus ferus]|nr:hypothetical protein CB1_001049006 [Camelus ferus]